MKALVVFVLLSLSISAFAEPAIVGTWYIPYERYTPTSFSPESLIKIEANGMMTTERIFFDKKQKVVTKTQLEITDSTVKEIKEIPSMTCPGLTDGPNQTRFLNYTVEKGILRYSYNGQSSPPFFHPTAEQIKKFADAVVGCN